jgi:hypothetical protein
VYDLADDLLTNFVAGEIQETSSSAGGLYEVNELWANVAQSLGKGSDEQDYSSN